MGKVKKSIKKEQAVDETAVATKTKKNVSQTKSQSKLDIDFEATKKLFATICKVSEDKYHFTAIRAPETEQVICYLMKTKQGVSHYTKKDGSWKVAEILKSQEQINKLFESVQKQIETRKHWADALTPRYVHGEFSTTDRQQMLEHLKALL